MAKITESAESKRWRAQNDANALVEADEIKADPKRMTGVAGHIKRQEKAVQQQKKKYVVPKPKVKKKAAKKKAAKKTAKRKTVRRKKR